MLSHQQLEHGLAASTASHPEVTVTGAAAFHPRVSTRRYRDIEFLEHPLPVGSRHPVLDAIAAAYCSGDEGHLDRHPQFIACKWGNCVASRAESRSRRSNRPIDACCNSGPGAPSSDSSVSSTEISGESRLGQGFWIEAEAMLGAAALDPGLGVSSVAATAT